MDASDLRAWRARHRLTQRELADMLGMTPQRLSQLERDSANGVLRQIMVLAIEALTARIEGER